MVELHYYLTSLLAKCYECLLINICFQSCATARLIHILEHMYRLNF